MQSFSKLRNETSGFTLLEVLVALAIFAIGILGVARMQIGSSNGNTTARKFTEASEIAQGQIETLMLADFADIADGSIETADGYETSWTIMNQADTDADGTNDMMVIQVAVKDPAGRQRCSYRFSKFEALDP